MANKQFDRPDGSAGGAVATREKRVSQSQDDSRSDRPTAGTSNTESLGGIYKPGQGYYTRVWTAIGAGTLVVWFVWFLWQKLEVVSVDRSTTLAIQAGMAVVVLGLFGWLGFRLLGKNRTVCDFLIATEGEMKKVNWSTRKEVIGSTKVVVFVLVAMSLLLFIVDMGFLLLFTELGVLKGKSLVDAMLGAIFG